MLFLPSAYEPNILGRGMTLQSELAPEAWSIRAKGVSCWDRRQNQPGLLPCFESHQYLGADAATSRHDRGTHSITSLGDQRGLRNICRHIENRVQGPDLYYLKDGQIVNAKWLEFSFYKTFAILHSLFAPFLYTLYLCGAG